MKTSVKSSCWIRLSCPGMVYFLPTPKSPHGCDDVDPTGEYIVGSW